MMREPISKMFVSGCAQAALPSDQLRKEILYQACAVVNAALKRCKRVDGITIKFERDRDRLAIMAFGPEDGEESSDGR